MLLLAFLALPLLLTASQADTPNAFTASDLLHMKYVTSAEISPDGNWIAYTVRVPREAQDEPGSAYSELYVVSVKTGEIRPFITGKVAVYSIEWRPDGSVIAFRSRMNGQSKTQVWLIPFNGGEARALTASPTGVLDFHWSPSGKQIAYIATNPRTMREKELAEKGFDFIFYDEEWEHRNLYLMDVSSDGGNGEPRQVTQDITIWSFVFSPDGKYIAAGSSEKNLIDYRYMFQKIRLLNLETGELSLLTNNPGKLGNFAFSPDGKHLAYTAAGSQSDHAVSQVYVMPAGGGEPRNLTIPDFRGHVEWVGWKDNSTILYRAGEGVWPTLSTVKITGGDRSIILNSKDDGIIFEAPSYTKNFRNFAFVGNSPKFPDDLFYWNGGKEVKRLTSVNPSLAEKSLGKQEVIQYKARDGVEIEGMLIYPVDYQQGQKYPLIMYVHGGPESHYSNGWLTRYSTPGQVLAGKEYAVFYPNYRASTGYGVDFAMQKHLGNAAGTEFDDVADGLDYLVAQGIADKERVGLGGGSYGGYAAAWFATYYTKYVRAVCMFVGISDLISKRGTTDIPWEELYVHSGKKLEEMWDISLKRSPIYYAHQSETATLIMGGASDTRVSPSQSLELYTRLKMNGKKAVRLVRYPGEGHGNRMQPGRIDVLYRTLQWFDWYVKDAKPLNGPLPPLDISNDYGLDLPENN
ncbi:MAG: S9 family peptidase [Calditrichia bacterium]